MPKIIMIKPKKHSAYKRGKKFCSC